ncbi:MAG: ABC transporter [Dehalococcoidia bacterium]|nr:ABC transporter [Dehalococcoidia bacterium]
MSEVFTGFWVVGYREFLRLLRERARLASAFVTPLLLLVIFGAGFNRIVAPLDGQVDLVQFMFPGIVCMSVLMTALFSGLSVVWDREVGFLKVVLVAPLSRVGIALGKTAAGSGVGLFQGLLLMILAPFIGLSIGLIALVTLLPLLFVLAVTLSAIGIFVGSQMRSQQAFHGVVEILIVPMVFFSGVFFPVDKVPTWLGILAKLNPLTYGVDAIRQVILNARYSASFESTLSAKGGVDLGVTVFGHRMSVWEDALVVSIFGLIVLVMAARSFNRQGT